FPVANEVSIRDGLMHSFASMWYGGAPALRGEEAFRGRALESAFFSSVAIGGLLSGQPPSSVENHVKNARASAVEFRGLSDSHAVSALILSGMMGVLLPDRESRAAGRRSLDEAEAIFESLADKDPLVGVILTFRRQVEDLALLDAASVCPLPSSRTSPAVRPSSLSSTLARPAVPRKGGGKPRPVVAGRASSSPSVSSGPRPPLSPGTTVGGDGESGGVLRGPRKGGGVAHTDEGKAIIAGLDGGRGGFPLTEPAHPSFVVADALLLSVRFMREESAGGISRLRHVHDFVASELNRLVPGKAGALVLVSLAGTLLAVKTRLQLTDGMLPMAELITVMLTKCPGWGR
ncbi:unnamed protein product, partial [Hapterophycus canaliculatus]